MATEKIYLGRDNTIERKMKIDGVALTSAQMQAISRMTMKFGNTLIDSDTVGKGPGTPFDWETREDEGTVIFALGGQSITAGEYWPEWTVYDSVNDDGIVWESFPVEVV